MSSPKPVPAHSHSGLRRTIRAAIAGCIIAAALAAPAPTHVARAQGADSAGEHQADGLAMRGEPGKSAGSLTGAAGGSTVLPNRLEFEYDCDRAPWPHCGNSLKDNWQLYSDKSGGRGIIWDWEAVVPSGFYRILTPGERIRFFFGKRGDIQRVTRVPVSAASPGRSSFVLETVYPSDYANYLFVTDTWQLYECHWLKDNCRWRWDAELKPPKDDTAFGVERPVTLDVPIGRAYRAIWGRPEEHDTAPRGDRVDLGAAADTWIAQGRPNTNFGLDAGVPGTEGMKAGYEDRPDRGAGIVRGLVQFDLSSIPERSTVSFAVLRLHWTYSRDSKIGRTRTVAAYRVTDQWAEYEVTWSTAPGHDEGQSYDAMPFVHEQFFHRGYDWDVTRLVKQWVSGAESNHGVMFRTTDENFGMRGFATREGGEEYEPKLIVYYTAPTATAPPPTAETPETPPPTQPAPTATYTPVPMPTDPPPTVKPVEPRILYVDGGTGSDHSDCTASAQPCATISYALGKAHRSDTIRIARGEYPEHLDVTEPVKLHGGYDPSDWSTCFDQCAGQCLTVVVGDGSRPVIKIEASRDEVTEIVGFEVKNGTNGISIHRSLVGIRNSRIVHNAGPTYAGGGIRADNSQIAVERTVVAHNQENGNGGGINILCSDPEPVAPNTTYCKLWLYRSTVAYNAGGTPKGVFCSLSLCDVQNSIIWGHDGSDIAGWFGATYSNVEQGAPGEGNISAEPRFRDPENDDFRLKPGSPCCGAGRPDDDGTPTNMGACPCSTAEPTGTPKWLYLPYVAQGHVLKTPTFTPTPTRTPTATSTPTPRPSPYEGSYAARGDRYQLGFKVENGVVDALQAAIAVTGQCTTYRYCFSVPISGDTFSCGDRRPQSSFTITGRFESGSVATGNLELSSSESSCSGSVKRSWRAQKWRFVGRPSDQPRKRIVMR